MSRQRDNYSADYRKQEAQLIIGLKFHYGKSLKDLPLDVAVDAMVKEWESCQDESQAPSKGIMNEQPRRIAPQPTKPAPRYKFR